MFPVIFVVDNPIAFPIDAGLEISWAAQRSGGDPENPTYIGDHLNVNSNFLASR
jgi:hypothetical protein